MHAVGKLGCQLTKDWQDATQCTTRTESLKVPAGVIETCSQCGELQSRLHEMPHSSQCWCSVEKMIHVARGLLSARLALICGCRLFVTSKVSGSSAAQRKVTCVSAGPAHTLLPCWYRTRKGAGSSLSHTPSTEGSAAARVMKSNGLNTMRRSILVISEGGRRVGLNSTPQKYSPYLCCAGPTYLNHAQHHVDTIGVHTHVMYPDIDSIATYLYQSSPSNKGSSWSL